VSIFLKHSVVCRVGRQTLLIHLYLTEKRNKTKVQFLEILRQFGL